MPSIAIQVPYQAQPGMKIKAKMADGRSFLITVPGNKQRFGEKRREVGGRLVESCCAIRLCLGYFSFGDDVPARGWREIWIQ